MELYYLILILETFNVGVHTLLKNLGATSKFWIP